MNYKKILLIVSSIILLGVVVFFIIDSTLIDPEFGRITKETTQKEEVSNQEISYILNRGEGNISEYKIKDISADSTVFSLLEKLSKSENFEIETTSYGEMGILVDSIDGLKGGEDNKWWQYWINDELGKVAADKNEVKAGDKIEWRFEMPLEF